MSQMSHMKQIERSAFLYMEPPAEAPHKETAAEEEAEDFAQCSSCIMWDRDKNRCAIHGPKVEVTGTMSCGLYVPGSWEDMPSEALVTPEESGLEDRKMRCENCHWFKPTAQEAGNCRLYAMLNHMPGFELDEKVSADGCCNANTPPVKDQMAEARKRLIEVA